MEYRLIINNNESLTIAHRKLYIAVYPGNLHIHELMQDLTLTEMILYSKPNSSFLLSSSFSFIVSAFSISQQDFAIRKNTSLKVYLIIQM